MSRELNKAHSPGVLFSELLEHKNGGNKITMVKLLQNLRQGLKIFLSRRWIFLAIILTFSLPGSILAVLQRLFFSTQLLNPYFLLDTLMGIFIISIGSYAAVRAAQGCKVNYTEAMREGSRKLGKLLVVYFLSYIAILI
jgi:hypothetical protein